MILETSNWSKKMRWKCERSRSLAWKRVHRVSKNKQNYFSSNYIRLPPNL